VGRSARRTTTPARHAKRSRSGETVDRPYGRFVPARVRSILPVREVFDDADGNGPGMPMSIAGQAAGDMMSTGSPTLDALLPFVNLGVLAVVVIMVITRRGFVPAWSLSDAEKDRDRERQEIKEQYDRAIAFLREQVNSLERERRELRDQVDALSRNASEQVLPALLEANRITALYVDALARRAPL
jgi:hypothetical protein